MHPLRRFKDMSAGVTDASGGLGAAIARWFVADGAAVVLGANEERVHSVAEGIRSGRGAAVCPDLSLRLRLRRAVPSAERGQSEPRIG